MVVPLITINSLPNEILISILSHFPTLALLPLTTTSQRIHDLILAILSHRISEVGPLKNHQLLLEAFHTSHRGAGYSICHPLQTLTLHSSTQTEHTSSLTELSNLYASFRPRKPAAERGRFRAGLADGGGLFFPIPAPPQPTNEAVGEGRKGKEELVTQDIHLESHELFSQLCTRANLVKTSPRRGLFHSCVNVGEGILRVWRDWLSARAERAECGETNQEDLSTEILWADSKKSVGLRFTVVEREAHPVEPPYRVGEERDVSYCLFYEELLVRSTKLLLTVERSEELEAGNEGNAIVFGDWNG